MKNLVIVLMFVAFSLATMGCEYSSGQCPQGVCKQGYVDPKAKELGENPPGSGGGEGEAKKE